MVAGQYKRELSAFSDVLLAVVSYLAVLQWRGPDPGAEAWYVGMVAVVVGVWWLLSVAIRRDTPYRLGGVWAELTETVLLNAIGGLLLVSLNWLTKHDTVSRLVLVGFPILSCVLAAAFRLAVRELLAFWRSQGHDARHVLLVGPWEPSVALGASLMRRDTGLRPVGVLVPQPDSSSPPGETPLQVLGDYGQLAEVLHSRVVDQLAVTAPLDDPGLRPVVDTALREGKTVWLALDAFGARLLGHGHAGNVLVLSPQRDGISLAAKRVMDVAVSALLLALSSPVLLAVVIAIKAEDPSAPIIFRQHRVGLHGRAFTCLKFRSMVPDAERRRAELPRQNEMDGPVFKIRNDPRITRVGRVLRRYSLDELPQLWNVLRGDMSLVGPRPPLPDEVREYRPEFRRRLAFRPGLTCLWQVSGRNRVDFNRWMELDLHYVDNWSVWLDLQILLRTIPTVLFGSGM